MCCFEPGEVVVLPNEGDYRRAELGLERAYSARDILANYVRNEGDVSGDALEALQSFRAQPFVARVREGTEVATALELNEHPRVAAAIPNYFIRTAGSFKIDDAAIGSLTLDALWKCPTPLRRPRIAIVDTGVSASALRGKVTLSPVQFDVRSPGRGAAPSDDQGHGTVVAKIIEHLAPDVEIQSICAAPGGSIAGVIMAIQIAMCTFRPDVVNLSLSIDLHREACLHCGHPVSALFPEGMVHSFFQHLDYHPFIELPTYVVAAGNYSQSVKLPARCANTLAVGAYDLSARRRPSFALYTAVPSDRFVMAGRGNEDVPYGTDWKDSPFRGTSFSAAMVSAVVGQIAAAHDCGSTRRECVMRNLPGVLRTHEAIDSFEPGIHGLGVIA